MSELFVSSVRSSIVVSEDGAHLTITHTRPSLILTRETPRLIISRAGTRGLRGLTGNPGISTYELAVMGGFVGTEAQWLASLRGPTGYGVDGQDGTDGIDAYALWAMTAGSSELITAQFPTLTSLADGTFLRLRATYANVSTAPKLSINGAAFSTIYRDGGQPLLSGDIAGPMHELLLVIRSVAGIVYYELLNPATTTMLAPGGNATGIHMGTQFDHNFLPGMPICKVAGVWVMAAAGNVNAMCTYLVSSLIDANHFMCFSVGTQLLSAVEWYAITGDAVGLVANENYFLGLTPGTLTKTPPETGVKQFILWAETNTLASFNPGEALDVTPGTFIAGPVIADHSTTATRWTTPRNIALTGVVTGNVTLDGSGNVSFATFMADNAIAIAKVSGLAAALATLQSNINLVTSSGQSNRRVVTKVGHDFIPGTVLTKEGSSWKRASTLSNPNTAVVFVAQVLGVDTFSIISGGWLTLSVNEWMAVIDNGVAPVPGEYYFLSSTPGNVTRTFPVTGIKQGLFCVDDATTVLIAIEPPQDITP